MINPYSGDFITKNDIGVQQITLYNNSIYILYENWCGKCLKKMDMDLNVVSQVNIPKSKQSTQLFCGNQISWNPSLGSLRLQTIDQDPKSCIFNLYYCMLGRFVPENGELVILPGNSQQVLCRIETTKYTLVEF